jgi:hypothetical protein
MFLNLTQKLRVRPLAGVLMLVGATGVAVAAEPEIAQSSNSGTSEVLMKRGYSDDIEQATLQNEDFRRVLYTGSRSSSWF